MWVRGLKHLSRRNLQGDLGVAPYVGAWIETPRKSLLPLQFLKVAPYVGAWIETQYGMFLNIIQQSHPTCMRGLKHSDVNGYGTNNGSHPTWI